MHKNAKQIEHTKAKKSFRRRVRLSKIERTKRNFQRTQKYYPLGSFENYRKTERKMSRFTETIIPCECFELMNNPSEVIKFVSELKDYKYRTDIYEIIIDLKKIKTIDNGAISLLLSSVHELSINRKSVRGTMPEDETANDILIKSGFFTNISKVSNQISKKIKTNNSKNVLIIADKNTSNRGKIIGQAIKNAMSLLTGVNEHNRDLYTLMIEMNLNSFEHAYEGDDKHWVIGINYDDKLNKLYFTFTDNGFGILEQLNIKNSLLIKQAVADFNYSNLLLLNNLFDKKYNSRFKTQINRNRGLPAIKDKFVNNAVKNLLCITNNVILDFTSSENSKIIQSKFLGTFYYWELEIDNVKNIC